MISVLVRRRSHSSFLPIPDHADDEYQDRYREKFVKWGSYYWASGSPEKAKES